MKIYKISKLTDLTLNLTKNVIYCCSHCNIEFNRLKECTQHEDLYCKKIDNNNV